jgi:hypothetical protein
MITPTAAAAAKFLALAALLALPAAAALPNGYASRRSITVASAVVPSAQANFPMLVSGTYSYLRTVANGGQVVNATTLNGHAAPADLVFSSDDLGVTPLSWEVDSYDPSSGSVSIWVNVPAMSNGAVIYEFVGNSAVTSYQGAAASAWDSGYAGVYHFSETSGQHLDSTAGGNASTAVSSAAEGSAAGQVGGADGETAAGNRTTLPAAPFNFYASSSPFTVSCWAKSSAWSNFVVLARISGSNNEIIVAVNSSGVMRVDTNGAVVLGSTVLTNGQWYYFTFTYAGGVASNGAIAAYLNGVPEASGAGAGQTNGPPSAAYVGGDPFVGPLNGPFDEARISGVARSADWVLAEYRNQSSPATFYAVGAEVVGGSGTVGSGVSQVIVYE